MENEEMDVHQTLGPNDMVYDVEKKPTSRDRLNRILYIAVWALGLIVIGAILLYIMPVLVLFIAALIPAIIFFFKKFYIYFNLGYRYRLDKGTMKVYVLYGKKGAGKRLLTYNLKDMEMIAPYNKTENGLDAYRAKLEREQIVTRYECASDMSGADVYFCLFNDPEKGRSVLFIDGTEKFIRIAKFYNADRTVPSTVSR